MPRVTIDDVEAAAARFADADIVQSTPVQRSRSLSDRCGAEVHLKMEHLQRTGSFKPRGAYNAVSRLVEADSSVDRVVAASAGNHAQGVALAATAIGLDATIVMPESAPAAKIEATRSYGAETVLHGAVFAEAMAHAVKSAGEMKVVMSGGSKTDDLEFCSTVEAVIRAGGNGLAVGRNVWQREDPERILDALEGIIYGGQTADAALGE